MDRVILAIEASNPSLECAATLCAPGVAIGRAGAERAGVEVLGVEPVRPATRDSDDLTPAIDRLCARLGVGAKDITRIAVSIGPGGYTSLRMACATAQMIALATVAKCMPVPTAAVAAECLLDHPALRSSTSPVRVGIALAGKADAAFITTFESGGTGRLLPVLGPTTDGALITSDELAALGLTHLACDAHLPAPLRARAEDLRLITLPLMLDASALLRAAARLPDDRAVEPAHCVPLYGREPEAVTKWRALHGAKAL